jgi:microcystin-dependent protein
MAVSSFKISQNLNIDGKIVDLQGTSTTNQVLAYSTSTNTFLPTLETPVGTVVMYGGSSVPTDWLLCDGQQILSTSALGVVLSTRYNTGGETAGNVRVPNFVSRLPVATGTAISNATYASGFATSTYTTTTPHGFATGNTVVVTGITPSSWNRTATITVSNSTQFYFSSFNGSTGGDYSSGGTALGPPLTSSVSSSDTFNHSHTATYGTNGANVDLAHNHTTGAPSADHNHALNSDKGNHAHGTTGSGGIGHFHNLSYKMGSVTQATSTETTDHTHGYSTNDANHSHLDAANSDVHSHAASALETTSHAHAHNSITLVTANQTTSISNHSHGSFNVMQMLFIIKT